MSYYDSSTLTKRKQNKVISNDFLNRLNSNNLSYGPQLGISSDSILNNVKTGNMKYINKCSGSFSVDVGCPCAQAPVSQPVECSTSYTASIFSNDILTGTTGGNFVKLIEVGSNIIGTINTPRTNLQNPAPVGVPLNLLEPIIANSTPTSLLTVSSNTSRAYGIVVSYNKDGTLNWVTKIDTPTSESNIGVFISDITFDNTGIYVTGAVGSIVTPIPSGSLQLNLYNAVTSDLTTNIADKTLTMDNKVQNGFVVKYDFNGIVLWALKIQVPSSGLSPLKIYAFGGLVYCSANTNSITPISIYNSSDVLKSTLTGSRCLAICAITSSGDIAWVDKITFSGTSGVLNMSSLIYENNVLYLCFNTYNQTMQVYASNLLADPTIISQIYNYNIIPPLTPTNGMKTIVLALNTTNSGIISVKNMYALKSVLSTPLNDNINTAVMKISGSYLILGGWFRDIIISTNNLQRVSAPLTTINGILIVLDKDNLIEYNVYNPFGSESRVYDLAINGDNIIACGLSNGTVTFPSSYLPNVNFTALGANDAIIYSYNFMEDNINWITNWQSPTFDNALTILNSGNCYYVGGYVDGATEFYTPNLTTRLPNTEAALTYIATARSPSLSIFTI
jgi:hypothetical protein